MNDNTSNNVVEPLFRCAIYKHKHGASNVHWSESLDYQEQICRQGIASRGMVVEELFVRGDVTTSGTSLRGREELDSLIAAANNHPRPFDYIVMADADRLGRNCGNILEVYQTLKQLGVNLYFVSEKLDSRVDDNFVMMLAMRSMIDEAYRGRRQKKATSAGSQKMK
jgi:DNA invertase Pin-like site-specific DNA recombinase